MHLGPRTSSEWVQEAWTTPPADRPQLSCCSVQGPKVAGSSLGFRLKGSLSLCRRQQTGSGEDLAEY